LSTGLLKVIRASAGSGKTYTLVKEYLCLALKSKDAGSYKQILAITFTNAAAAEMKDRFVQALLRFSLEEFSKDSMFKEIAGILRISEEELRQRASKMFRHVLHNYSLLSITTIDSFTHRLIRSFAKDLHLSHDFGIEMDFDAFNELLVSECFEEMNNDEELTHYLVQFALENLKEERNWDFKSELIQMAKLLTDEESIDALKEFEGISLKEFQEIRTKIYVKKAAYEKEIKRHADEGLALLANNDISLSDFSYSGGGFVSRLGNFSDLEIKKPGKRYLEMLEKSDWAKKGIDRANASRIENILPQLKVSMEAISDMVSDEKFIRYNLYKKVSNRIYSLGLLSRMRSISEKIKREKNILLISDFHRLIAEVVDDSPAPFIYERIGMRYKHILIDEFQDTSALQWNNALPLIVNSLGEGKMNLLVGDAKQSIYRWRGGHPAQFVNLPALSEKHTLQIGSHVLHSHFAETVLDTNYRSAEKVIKFNNKLYSNLKLYLDSNVLVYDKLEQKSHREIEGYVQVDEVRGKNVDESWHITSERILRAIEESIAAGYRPGDIAILVRRNIEAAEISSMLKKNNYQVETSESFLLINSPHVRSIMGYLSYTVNPSSKSAAVSLIQALSEIRADISLEGWVVDSGQKISRNSLPDLQKYLSKYFNFTVIDNSWSPYHFVIKLINCFGFSADVYLEFLLEHIRQRTLSEKKSMLNLIDWWEEKKEKLNITTTADEHSIKLMTVHKSKGLQFPVVIYPRFAGRKAAIEKWVSLDKEEFGISRARLSLSKPDEGEPGIPEWKEENLMSNLDDINVCYVSTTRAEDRLYIINEVRDGANFWLTEKLKEVLNKELSDLRTSDTQWTIGSPNAIKPKEYSDLHAEFVHWNEEPVIPGVNFKNNSAAFQSAEMKFGEIIHFCLSIYSSDQNLNDLIGLAFSQYPDSLYLDRDEIKVHLEKIVEHPKISDWYKPGLNVKAEMDLVNSLGKLLRPDRVVFYDDSIDIIEFKTGLSKEVHEDQVHEYKSVISELTSLPINCFLVYTDSIEVRQV